MNQKYVTVLGATGSIGVQTLSVIQMHPERYRVFALTAYRNLKLFIEQCLAFQPLYAVVLEVESQAIVVQALQHAGLSTQVLAGIDALIDVSIDESVSIVVAGITGAAGLLPTFSAVKAGKRVLLANKESLVMAGGLMIDAAHASGAELLPIDSEHNAMFQCLPISQNPLRFPFVSGQYRELGVKKMILTASGGPFLSRSADSLVDVTPDEACTHPNWQMGRKISVDSATMMNKGLELIEACCLFAIEPNQVEVVIHPQSIIHSMVQYDDGSFLAQLGSPDMKTPIAHALAWPDRIAAGSQPLDWFSLGALTFLPPDAEKCICLSLARDAQCFGGNASIFLNAANEVAVAAFLENRIKFTDIPAIIGRVLEKAQTKAISSLDEVLHDDAVARSYAAEMIQSIS